ncbi:MAG: hypothetical protein CO189_03810 [candidate division Zixibacteria bacterium CG_4_9_14_3_um_filter_46_8]|nr:MAG: hypothetical protein CO189_03810 [candidate division Zixibacteria bacterium CG_4_9_14_3_um_filter_46_8]
MEIFRLKKPPLREIPFSQILNVDVRKFVYEVSSPEYLYWDRAKHKRIPPGLTPEEFWAIVKFWRLNSFNRVNTRVKDEKGNPFCWHTLPNWDYFLHECDMQLGGHVESPIWDKSIFNQRYVTRGIMEEAIASSQLEGASTTRKVAKRMILERRKPNSRSEQMIMNNYQAMREIEERLHLLKLSKPILLELHGILTQQTIKDDDVGRIRKKEDNVMVCDNISGIIYHIPPQTKFLLEELEEFIDFANDDSHQQPYLHPLIRAIILHFWMGYLHPFTDGNGRMARTIFYWYLLRKKYWGISYLPISKVIRQSPGQYRDAYIYTEQDDNDLTYFIDYIMRKIMQAKKEFETYIKHKEKENRGMAELARSKFHLNDRQIQLLRYFHKNSGATTTIKTHSNIYRVSRVTTKRDLEFLKKEGFVASTKVGRERVFNGLPKIQEIFQ